MDVFDVFRFTVDAAVPALASPLDGAVVSGTLRVSGTASSDKPEVIAVAAQTANFTGS